MSARGCSLFSIATSAARIAAKRAVFAGGGTCGHDASIHSSVARPTVARVCTGEMAKAGADMLDGRKRVDE